MRRGTLYAVTAPLTAILIPDWNDEDKDTEFEVAVCSVLIIVSHRTSHRESYTGFITPSGTLAWAPYYLMEKCTQRVCL